MISPGKIQIFRMYKIDFILGLGWYSDLNPEGNADLVNVKVITLSTQLSLFLIR